MGRWGLSAFAALLAACGEAPAVEPDAGPPDAGALGIAPPAPPAPAMLPDLGPCTRGWREVLVEEGVRVCDPWPEGGQHPCGPGGAHFPAEPDCAPVGVACPAGDWPEALPAAGLVYVRARAPAGGDGTPGAPYASISEALAVATDGTTIALAKGDYEVGSFALRAGVTLRGACARDTHIVSTTPSSTSGAVYVVGNGAVVRDVTIRGERPGIWVTGPIAVTIEGVIVDGAVMNGIRAENGATVTARSIAVRGTRQFAGLGGGYGDGIVSAGATVTLQRAVLERNHHAGVVAGLDGAAVHLEDVAIADNEPDLSDPPDGQAIAAIEAARIDGHHVSIERAAGGAIAAYSGSQLALEDVVIRDGQPRMARGGLGLSVQEGSTGSVSRLLAERTRSFAVAASGPGSTLLVSDAVLRDTTSTPASAVQEGRALEANAGARLEASRVLAVRAEGEALLALDEGTELVLDDVVVEDVRPTASTSRYGWCGTARSGGHLTARRLRVERCTEIALAAHNPGSELSLEDLVVRDVAPSADPTHAGGFGFAINTLLDATTTVSRALIERAQDGVIASSGATVRASDVVVRDLLGHGGGTALGRALMVQGAGTMTIERAIVDGARDVGVLASMGGAEIQLSDLVVQRTLGVAAAPELGIALSASDPGAHLEATRFLVTDSLLCGVQITRGAAMDLHEGTVSRGPIGANVQDESFDIGRISDRVSYVDNGVNLDSASLPLPPVADVVP